MVREVLGRLPELQTMTYLDALRDTLEFELWVARMELESITAPPAHEEKVCF
jgi:hypothetical protein